MRVACWIFDSSVQRAGQELIDTLGRRVLGGVRSGPSYQARKRSLRGTAGKAFGDRPWKGPKAQGSSRRLSGLTALATQGTLSRVKTQKLRLVRPVRIERSGTNGRVNGRWVHERWKRRKYLRQRGKLRRAKSHKRCWRETKPTRVLGE
jgi:hypothetical protein